MRVLATTASVVLSAAALLADTAPQRLSESATVLSEIMATPDKGIPQDLLAKAQCVIIVPNLKKAAFIVGGEYGMVFGTIGGMQPCLLCTGGRALLRLRR